MDYQMEDNRYQEDQTSGPTPSEPKQSPNNMATASLVMGILALVSCCCYYGGLVFGGLGILFALLSRTEKKMYGRAKAGLVLSVSGLVLMVLLWGGLIFFATAGSFYGSGGPFQNLPAIPEITQPELDNILTIFRNLPSGGGIR